MAYNPLDFNGIIELVGSTSGHIIMNASAITTNYSIIWPAAQGAASTVLTNNGSGILTWTSPSVGSVTNVALSLPSIFSVSGSPVTGSGTLTGTLNTQAANLVFAGPTTGSAAIPTFRSLVAADVPTLNQNTTGTAANITDSSNSTLNTLSALSLPSGQVSGLVASATTDTTNASNITSGTLAAARVATLNQNTTGTAASFTGNLSGDVTGPQGTTAISSAIVTGKLLTGYTIGANTPILATDSILAAFEKLQGQMGATAGAAITALTSDVSASGPGSATATVNSVGGSSAANVHAAELLANAATNLNTASTIVKRDASGNFTAGTITAALTGNASTATSATTAAGLSATLVNTSGGTGQSGAFNADGVVYASSTTVLATTAVGTAGQILTSNGAGVAPTFQANAAAPNYSNWVSYSPTFSAGFGTVSGADFYWRRFGDSVQIKGYVTVGTVTGSVLSATIPATLTIDSTKVANLSCFGNFAISTGHGYSPTVLANGNAGGAGTNLLTFGRQDSSNGGLNSQTGTSMFGNGDTISFVTGPIAITGWS